MTTIYKPANVSYLALNTHWEASGMVDGKVYLRDLDSLGSIHGSPHKYDVTDTEDPTSLDDTITIANYYVGIGPVVPCDAILINISHQFAEVGNVDGDVRLQTFNSVPIHAANTVQTLTLKHQSIINTTTMGASINRCSFSVTSEPDTSVIQKWRAGEVVILGLYSDSGVLGNPSVEGSTTWLFEIRGKAIL